MPEPQNRLERRTYTVREAAQILGVGRNAVYHLVRTGQLGALRMGAQGHRMVIPKDSVERLLADGMVLDQPAPAGAFTVTDAAQALGCTTNAIHELVRSGQLQAIRSDGNVFVPHAAIDRLLAQRSRPSHISSHMDPRT